MPDTQPGNAATEPTTEEITMLSTQTPVDLTDAEAEYLLSLLYRNQPGQLAERASLWTSTRSKVAARLGKR